MSRRGCARLWHQGGNPKSSSHRFRNCFNIHSPDQVRKRSQEHGQKNTATTNNRRQLECCEGRSAALPTVTQRIPLLAPAHCPHIFHNNTLPVVSTVDATNITLAFANTMIFFISGFTIYWSRIMVPCCLQWARYPIK